MESDKEVFYYSPLNFYCPVFLKMSKDYATMLKDFSTFLLAFSKDFQ